MPHSGQIQNGVARCGAPLSLICTADLLIRTPAIGFDGPAAAAALASIKVLPRESIIYAWGWTVILPLSLALTLIGRESKGIKDGAATRREAARTILTLGETPANRAKLIDAGVLPPLTQFELSFDVWAPAAPHQQAPGSSYEHYKDAEQVIGDVFLSDGDIDYYPGPRDVGIRQLKPGVMDDVSGGFPASARYAS